MIKWFAGLVCVLVLGGCASIQQLSDSDDIGFAQNTLRLLVKGDFAAADRIDWEMLRINGVDIGRLFMILPTPASKGAFMRTVLTNYAKSFQESGRSVENLRNWQVTFRDSARIELRTEDNSGEVDLSLSLRNGQRRLASISE